MKSTHPTRQSPRLFIWGGLGLVLIAALGGFVAALPRIAPQFVITHSPWMWPALRADAYDTEGKKLNQPKFFYRLFGEDEWLPDAVPFLTQALGHPDVRMRRTAARTLSELREVTIKDGWELPQPLVDALLQILDDPDTELFGHAFGLLIHHADSASAQAVLEHLPRTCGLVPARSAKPLDWRLTVFWGTAGEPHPLRFLRLALVVEQAQQWLTTEDQEFVRLALMVLGHTDDPRALSILDAHLGKHLEQEEFWVGWDPVSYALALSHLPGVHDLLAVAMADPDPVRRRSAASALGGRDGMGAIDKSLALLRAHIDDLDGEVRKRVAGGLVNYPLELTLPDLRHIVSRGGQPAVTAIDHIRSKRMFLHRPRPWWGRGNAVPVVDPDTPENWALEARIISELSAFVTHPEPPVRFALARYLCSTWEPDTERVLRSMADDPDPQVRAEIAAELHAITTRTRRDSSTYRSYQVPTASPTPP